MKRSPQTCSPSLTIFVPQVKTMWRLGRQDNALLVNLTGWGARMPLKKDKTAATIWEPGGVLALVSDDKWKETQSKLAELEALLLSNPDALPIEELEKIRGFSNFVAQNHKPMIPHLNGLHLTIHRWWPNRNQEGWCRTHM